MARRYRMEARAAAAQDTRRRIVEAAKALHAAQGILGTNYEEIARRAGTAPATVYRHFPALADLLPACACSIYVLQPLTPERAAETFAGVPHPWLRLELLVRGTCECYERDAGWLHAARREEDLIPALDVIVAVERENLRLLAHAALAGTVAGERAVRIVAALIDFPVWKSLRDVGLSGAEAADELLELVRVQLIRDGVL